jgi:hypothetical protein
MEPMSNKSTLLTVKAAILLNCIAIIGAFFYLYQRTTLHRWDNSLVPALVLLNILLIAALNRLKKHQEQNG